jgi:hypothetical protein
MKKIILLLTSVSLIGCASPSYYRQPRVVQVYETIEEVPTNNISANFNFGGYSRPPRVYNVPRPYYRPCNPDLIQQELNQRQIEAAQMNETLGGMYGRNRVSAALLDYQNELREVNARMQNPWNGHFARRFQYENGY